MTDDPIEEQASLERQLSQYKRNLYRLEEQQALFGPLNLPLPIYNELKLTQEAIQRIEERLHRAKLHIQQQTNRQQNLSLLSPNPFGHIGRISDPAKFFGREELLRQIFEELRKGSNRSLVGESQVGKSSLLKMVCYFGPERLGLPAKNFVYLDMQLIHDEQDFFDALCDSLEIPTCRGFRLARALRERRIILCLDEIEKMTKDRFTGDEREELRGLSDGIDAPFRLVIASRVPLDTLFPDTLGKTSPLANICPVTHVLPFRPEIARAFLESRLQGTGVTFTATEIDEITRESSGNPAKMQVLAAHVYERYQKQKLL